MGILDIAYCTIKRNLRDRKSMITMMVLPIVSILILGSALSRDYTPSNLKKAKVCYLNEDSGKIAELFTKFISMKYVKEVLEVRDVKNYDEALKLVDKNKADSIIVISKDYTKNIMSGKKAVIQVYNKKQGNMTAAIVKNVVDSFVSSANTMEAVYKLNGKINLFVRSTGIEKNAFTTNGKIPRAIDYYAITMLVMTLMYGSMYAYHGIIGTYFDEVGQRIKATPIKAYEVVIGFTLGSVVSVFGQGLVLILFTKYVYKANWGGNIGIILFVCFSLTVLSTIMGILTAIIDQNSGSGILNILVPIFTFVSGGYFQFTTENSVFKAVQNIVPNSLAQRAMFNTVYGGDSLKVISSIIIMWIITIILLIISSIAGRRVRR